MQKVVLPRSVVNTLLKLAQSDRDKEICGLISLDKQQNMQVIPVRNMAEQPECFFEMDPAETMQAMKKIRDDNMALFAIYHSHPHSPAYPSKTDIDQAGYPEALYLIISLNTEGVLELKGFKIQDDSVACVDLVL